MKKICHYQTSSLGDDSYLDPFRAAIKHRAVYAREVERRLTGGAQKLADFACAHEYFGLHRDGDDWIFREWAPNATGLTIIGTFCEWRDDRAIVLERTGDHGVWEAFIPSGVLSHGDLYKLKMYWQGGQGDRIPAYARRVVQDQETKVFSAQVWSPDEPYSWRYPDWSAPDDVPLVYETHIGMAQETEDVGTYEEFRLNILPRVAAAGYNALQIMAIPEHPYYGSFGYHVTSFFAASSRFGTPEEFKALVDEAHSLGLAVIIDLVHSHSAKNEIEGLSRFDGTSFQYFHAGGRGNHPAWDSKCFDYGKTEVLHFLLSNCRFWLDEYHVDGFRFDGVTSMIYLHHGLGDVFTTYDMYFNSTVDEDAVAYLTLANKLIHDVKESAVTIAEDVSGMPGLGAPLEQDGMGFDYRLALGIPDCWFKLVRDVNDDDWSMHHIWHELTNRRNDERTISYVECHDQAIVGSKTLIFELLDAEMYHFMQKTDDNATIERGMALHKMIRLATLATAGHGYLNFMGNEFGHPEWIDFPREGNSWSFSHARRQWGLRDSQELKYHFLADFDSAMLHLVIKDGILKGNIRLLTVREDDHILAFERGGAFFFLNFHPTQSQSDYFIETPRGEYDHVLDSDQEMFGGQGRIRPGQKFVTERLLDYHLCREGIRVYLPCRTGMVLLKR